MKHYRSFLPILALAVSLLTVPFSQRAEAVSLPADHASAAGEIPIFLSDSGSVSDSAGVTISGSTVTVSAAGDYVLTGSLSDGQIVIDAPGGSKVRLILDGVSVISRSHAAIYALSADTLVLSTAEGSENFLQAAGEFVQTDANTVDAAVYACCDLTLSGGGTLNVSSLHGHAIVTRDNLRLKSGTLNLEAAGKGLVGKDSVTIEGGVVNADVGTDGIYTENAGSKGMGRVIITGGTLNLLTQKEGIDAAGEIRLEGGSIVINAGSGMEGKGIESDADITVAGGDLSVTSVDDALHADGSVTVTGGDLTLSSGDDGIHADVSVSVSNGVIFVRQSYEGIEAQEIRISGGELTVNAHDDGLNAAGGNDGSNSFGFFGGDPFASDSGASICISGGLLVVDADGDGLDSNGYLTVSGGDVRISGPTSAGNGALDAGIEATVTGGTVVAAGAAGMAENFGQNSTQGSILISFHSVQTGGTPITVTDGSGRVLISYQPLKNYSCAVVSCPEMVLGGTYAITAGSETQTVTLDRLIYGSGYGMPGRPGDMHHGRPGAFSPADPGRNGNPVPGPGEPGRYH